MSNTSPAAWCERLQQKFMAALEAAWALIETSDDPVVLKKAREKARLCGVMAASARRIAAMVPVKRPARGIDRLKGGGRSRL